jgi:thiol-disulfide isomerase/thioredoxin
LRQLSFLGGLLMVIGASAHAAPIVPPALDSSGLDEYRAYIEAPDHRAFAVAPGGAWGWVAGEATEELARDKAIATCQANSTARCVEFGVDGRIVFDRQGWARLWGPYATAREAGRATIGTSTGRRFPDLVFSDARGKRRSLASFRNKVVVLHFWGTWCPPCRREMPELQKLGEAVADRKDVEFVVLQTREPFAVSSAWAEKQRIRLALHDSGSSGEDDAKFRLASGGLIADREIASRFPTTYVLDKHGLVVFAHVGPVHAWPQYEPFLRDAADRSGR